MQVEKLKVTHYRNYKDLYISLDSGVNVFVGDNAQGKTNLIEAVYFAAYLKSFRQSKEKVLIQEGESLSYIGCQMKNNKEQFISEILLFEDDKKRVKVNKYEIDKKSEYLGRIHAVVFSPDDMKMVKEGPSERRTFLDEMLSKFYPVYTYHYKKYQRLLYQRNALLKRISYQKEGQILLDSFDEQLSQTALEVLKRRRIFLEQITPIFQEIYHTICEEKEQADMKYFCTLEDVDTKEQIFKKYKEVQKNDLERGQTTLGPHRDDLLFYIDQRETKKYASQGQIRSVALSLRLSEVFLIQERFSEYPILLLDDVLSELDEKRRYHLIKYFEKMQTLITTTDSYHLKNLKVGKYFEIREGKVMEPIIKRNNEEDIK